MSAVVPTSPPGAQATGARAQAVGAPPNPARPRTDPYDALLLVSFGGPEGPDDVLPFLRNVTRGRDIPAHRLAEVADHYQHMGGRSPINAQSRAFLAAVAADLAQGGVEVSLYWGNRNWDPFLAQALGQMRADGVRRAAAFVTSAYSSYSGCRQYREDLAAAAAHVAADGGGPAPRIDKLRHYFDHPGFVGAAVDAVRDALSRLPAPVAPHARLVFVTHSIPTAMAQTSGPAGGAYTAQHRAVAAAVTAAVPAAQGDAYRWDLAFCSRSGPASVPWLEPDVNTALEALAADGVPAVVVVPIGFVSDHMEVVYDLDTEAAGTAARLGLSMARAATAGTHPGFVAVVRDLLVERAAVERGERVDRAAVSPVGPSHDVCPPGCCRNPRGLRPALGGSD